VFLCPGATDEITGEISYAALRKLVVEISEQWRAGGGKVIFVARTPLYLKAYEEIFLDPLAQLPGVSVVLNPAQYRQSRSQTDMRNNPLHVVASNDGAAAAEIANLYQGTGVKCDIVPVGVAELLPAVCDSFHALKVAFSNEVGALANAHGLPGDKILQLLAKDNLLNTSSAYLRPGHPYGGLALPRGLQQLSQLSSKAKLQTPLLSHVDASNEAHYKRVVEALKGTRSVRVGCYGLSYRPDTDDTRGSSPVRMVESLLALGKQVRVYDPQIQYQRLEGANWFSLLTQLPLAEKLLTNNFEELVSWSEELVLFHPPSKTQAELIQSLPVPVLNYSGVALNEI
jgi:GDP-mannose 6-dehydrogenase